MTKKNYTHITLLVDRSGSMGAIKDDAQGGINELISAHKEAPGQCTFAIYEFDDQFGEAFAPANISTLEGYTLHPRGSTALYDAQWRAIANTGSYLRSIPESQRPEKVIFVTVTDGQENASREFAGPAGLARLKAKVEEQTEKYSWEFVYIGANQDAFAVGNSFGVQSTTSYVTTPLSTKAMYANVATATLNSRSGMGTTMDYMASSVAEDGTLTFDKESKEATTSTGETK